MDIKFNPIQPVNAVKKYQGTQRATAASENRDVRQASDKVDFSDSGKLYAQAMKKAMSTPEVREKKVAELRERVQNGTYSPSSRDIAKKMLGNLKV